MPVTLGGSSGTTGSTVVVLTITQQPALVFHFGGGKSGGGVSTAPTVNSSAMTLINQVGFNHERAVSYHIVTSTGATSVAFSSGTGMAIWYYGINPTSPLYGISTGAISSIAPFGSSAIVVNNPNDAIFGAMSVIRFSGAGPSLSLSAQATSGTEVFNGLIASPSAGEITQFEWINTINPTASSGVTLKSSHASSCNDTYYIGGISAAAAAIRVKSAIWMQ